MEHPSIDEDDDVIFVNDERPTIFSALRSKYSSGGIKAETLDDVTLKSVADNLNEPYNESDVLVRPWIDCKHRKRSINVISQFFLYKCMHENCMFATDSEKDWQMHMQVHHQLIGYFERHNLLDKLKRDKLIRFRQCAYCDFQANTDQQYLIHIEEEHQRSIFQCMCCFYRTIEIDNMVLHMKANHPDTHEILLCGESRRFNQQDEEILALDCDAHVDKIACKQGIESETIVHFSCSVANFIDNFQFLSL